MDFLHSYGTFTVTNEPVLIFLYWSPYFIQFPHFPLFYVLELCMRVLESNKWIFISMVIEVEAVYIVSWKLG